MEPNTDFAPTEIEEINDLQDYIIAFGYKFNADVPEGYVFLDYFTGEKLATPFKIKVVEGHLCGEATMEMVLAVQAQERGTAFSENDFIWLQHALGNAEKMDKADTFYSDMDLCRMDQYLTQLDFLRLSIRDMFGKCLRIDLLAQLMPQQKKFEEDFNGFYKLYLERRSSDPNISAQLKWINKFIKEIRASETERAKLPDAVLRVVSMKFEKMAVDQTRLAIVPSRDVQVFIARLKEQARQQNVEEALNVYHHSLLEQILRLRYLEEKGVIRDPLKKMTPEAEKLIRAFIAAKARRQ